MWPFSHSIDDLKEADLQSLIDGAVRESSRLDYKSDYKSGEQGSRSILIDVSSLANAHGGFLIVGVPEDRDAQDGTPKALIGIDKADDQQQRIENLCHGHIKPPIIGVRVKDITLNKGKAVIVVQVPESANKPHQFTLGKVRDFYCRRERQNHQMSAEEIRLAAIQTELAGQQQQALIGERLQLAEDFYRRIAKQEHGRVAASGVPLPVANRVAGALWLYCAPLFVDDNRIQAADYSLREFLKNPVHHNNDGQFQANLRTAIPTAAGIEAIGSNIAGMLATCTLELQVLWSGMFECNFGGVFRDQHDEFLFIRSIEAAIYWWSRQAFLFTGRYLDQGAVTVGGRLDGLSNVRLQNPPGVELPGAYGTRGFAKSALRFPTLRPISEQDWKLVGKYFVDRIYNAFHYDRSPAFKDDGTLLISPGSDKVEVPWDSFPTQV